MRQCHGPCTFDRLDIVATAAPLAAPPQVPSVGRFVDLSLGGNFREGRIVAEPYCQARVG